MLGGWRHRNLIRTGELISSDFGIEMADRIVDGGNCCGRRRLGQRWNYFWLLSGVESISARSDRGLAIRVIKQSHRPSVGNCHQKRRNSHVTERFHDYQHSVTERTKVNKLTWHDTYEILVISSIDVSQNWLLLINDCHRI